jgi:hypothetical protein
VATIAEIAPLAGVAFGMDEEEGFFPERRLLAYRRSLQAVTPDRAPTANKSSNTGWLLFLTPDRASTANKSSSTGWLLFICMAPSYLAIWGSMAARHTPGGHRLPIIVMLSCLLMIPLIGICVGIYRAIRSGQAPRNIL